LNILSDFLISKCAFECNLYRYAEEGEGVSEEKEDVPKNLEVAVDGAVIEAHVVRTVAPVRWSNAHIKAGGSCTAV
jgi:hypothetical protein